MLYSEVLNVAYSTVKLCNVQYYGKMVMNGEYIRIISLHSPGDTDEVTKTVVQSDRPVNGSSFESSAC
jgi:hypothetical protein